MEKVLQKHFEVAKRGAVVRPLTQACLHCECVSEWHTCGKVGEVRVLLERVFHCFGGYLVA